MKDWKIRWEDMRSSSQRGAVLLFLALALPILVVCAGMAVDMGRAYLHKSYLQNVADAAALAGAGGAQGSGRARLVTERDVDEGEYGTIVSDSGRQQDAYLAARPILEKNTGDRVDLQVVGPGLQTELRENEEDDAHIYYYRVELREAVEFLFAQVFLPKSLLPNWTVAAVAWAKGQPTGPSLYDQMMKIKTEQTFGSYQETFSEMEYLGFSNKKERARWYEDTTAGIYYVYNPETGKLERYEYGYPGMEYLQDNTVVDEQGQRTDGQGKKDKYLNVRSLYIDFKPDVSVAKGIDQNWDVGDVKANGAYVIPGNTSYMNFGTSRGLNETQMIDAMMAYFEENNITKTRDEVRAMLREAYQTRIQYTLNFNRLYEVRGTSVEELEDMQRMSDAERQLSREGRLSRNAEKNLWAQATRDYYGNAVVSDPLLVHIESEEINAGDGAQSDTIGNNRGGSAINSVRKITINIQVNNINEKYRPVVFFYDGPATLDNVAVGNRKSQTVTLNLEQDFKGILFAPNSPVCIKGNGHKLRGFVVAEKYVDERGDEIPVPGSSKEFYKKFGLEYGTGEDAGGYADFGLIHIYAREYLSTDNIFLTSRSKLIF